MKIIFAEAVSTELVEDNNGNKLCHARVLSADCDKYKIINDLFENTTISYFLKIGDCLNNYIKNEKPLVFVTDWTDPTEMLGLRLEEDGKVADYPDLCFLAFNTEWDIKSSGIEEIFAHEFSHLWLSLLGYDFKSSQSNKFHTCTAITDPFMAFSEGLAEHLEIVTKDLMSSNDWKNALWDHGYDVNAWLCLRDEQLRYHGVINNRFIYHTAIPSIQDNEVYNNLHMEHITSSAFTPERIKNANQMMASEGVISSVFYQMYKHEVFKNTYLDDAFYMQFGIEKDKVNPVTNLYLKILFAISKINLQKSSLMVDFIQSYANVFPDEKIDLYETFLKVTHYSTISTRSNEVFANLYRAGRRGEINAFKAALSVANEYKKDMLNKVLNGEVSIDNALVEELWIYADKEITPTPWDPDTKVKYRIDINTATEIDFLALDNMTLEKAIELVRIRDSKGGFNSLDEFYNILRK